MTERPSDAVVAAFDLDGTLTEGGSVFRWLRHLCGSGAVWRAALARSGSLLWGALRSGPAADRAKESLLHAVLGGRALVDVERASRDFALAHLAHAGRPVYLERLTWHLEQGHHVVIVSASPELYVGVIADALGAEGFVGTRLAVDPLGRLTGGYLGRNCRGEEKERRLRAWIADRGFDTDAEVYAYGNSRGDRRMLADADHPYDAGKLGPLGALRRYERLSTP